jgi:lysozyme
MYGVDFSGTDENVVDWELLHRRGKSFAIVRATMGARPDGAFDGHWTRMRAAGLVRGAYHHLRHDQSGREQANGYLRSVKLACGDLPPIVGIEAVDRQTAPGFIEALREWLTAVEASLTVELGHPMRPMIYTSARAWQLLGNPSGFEAYPLWIVDWFRFDPPRVPTEWNGAWTVHQYAGDTRGIPGISRHADLDRWNVAMFGDRGRHVERIKDLLHAADVGDGLSAGPLFDQTVHAAVLRFQQARGLVDDGMVGPATFAALQWPRSRCLRVGAA